jgi:hypothetical protein
MAEAGDVYEVEYEGGLRQHRTLDAALSEGTAIAEADEVDGVIVRRVQTGDEWVVHWDGLRAWHEARG